MDLAEARQTVRAGWRKGVLCPCCGQMVKLYKRKMYATMIRDLIALYHLRHDMFHHVTDFCSKKAGGGDFAKLRYWGLVEESTIPGKPHKRKAGFWKITEIGIAFVEGRAFRPQYVLVYNQHARFYEGDNVNVEQALGEDFNYQELMNV